MAAPTTKPTNFVDQDEIWKVHVHTERESAKAWPKKWGFLSEVCRENQRESAKLKDVVKLELPDDLKTRPPTPPERYIHVGPSPPVPQTTQALIGWRSTQSQLQFETYGSVNHGRRSILKDLGWSLDSCS